MSGEIVIQSAPSGWPGWINRCTASVSRWAKARGLAYRILGDELFDPVPGEWMDAAGSHALPRTDYARLLWIKRLHQEGYDRVFWVDADVFVINQGLAIPDGDFLCREKWLYFSPVLNSVTVRPAVNNCAMAFRSGSALLAWYLERCRKAPGESPLDRLALGPHLLSAQHARTPFPLIRTIATLGPWMFDAILGANTRRIAQFFSVWRAPVDAAHICRSLGHTRDAPPLIPPELYDPLIDSLEQGALARSWT